VSRFTRRSIPCGLLLVVLSASILSAQPNSVVCSVSATPLMVRAEGLAERLGDVVLSCTGQPGTAVTGNLTVSLNTTIGNRASAGQLDVALTADNGSGPALLGNPVQQDTNLMVFAGITLTVGANGKVDLRVVNLRGDATILTSNLTSVLATLAFSPPSLLTMNSNRAVVGVPRQGLFATTQFTSVANQIGSPIPEELSFANLLKIGTRFSSTRITEGFPTAFEPRTGTADTGTRIMLRFTGLPSDARLFAPDVIIGANGLQPTAAGDFGGTVSGGQYAPGALALVRVQGVGSSGAGGYLAGLNGTGPFDSASEIANSNGTAVAVYEVIDSNSQAVETAQIPVFLGVPRQADARTVTIQREVFFGPIGGAGAPRFRSVTPGTDCTTLDDCSKYVPKLEAYPQHTSFTAVSGANFQMIWIPFENVGGGTMVWSARIEYRNGSGWLRVWPTSGLQGNNLRLDVIPMGLAVGAYEATLIIDAGSAGVARYPVTLEVKPLPVQAPTISSIGGAATFAGPLAPGGLATIKGAHLGGPNVSVMIDGKPARILYESADQINIQVPSDLTGATAPVVVTANGRTSAAQTVNVAAVAPGIFAGGVLNQDSRVNAPESPSPAGSIVQVFATGLLPVAGTARVEVLLDETYFSGADVPYAGEAPGVPGVQQVNYRLPSGLGTGTYHLSLCATPASGTRVCSPVHRISVRAQ
jgi:uncharacterized protein (TIGR03437 family)